MPEKDILEKTLEAYDEVFADIVNALLFEGRPVVDPGSLEDAQTSSFYKSEDNIRSLERDVSKYVKGLAEIRIAKIGNENQTNYDPQLPLRVIGYDGADYRSQYGSDCPYPVITLVLYFGERSWGKNRSLHDVLNIPDEMKPYVNDYKLNLFEIAYLTDEQINRFHSDFRVIADLIAHRRTDPYYHPRGGPDFVHGEEVRHLMSFITGDRRYLEEDIPPERRSNNMDPYLDRMINRGREEGREEERLRMEAETAERDKKRVIRMHEMGNTPENISIAMDLDLALVREWLSLPTMA
jgi:hypothetical protein